VLLHKEMTLIRPARDKNPGCHCCDLYAKARDGYDGYEVDFRDPVDGGNYLVGYAPIRLTDDVRWAVLVQHPHEAVVAPANNLRFTMLIWGLLMLLAAAVFLVCFWAWLAWTLRFKGGVSDA
jgi:hypothetical protein